MPGTALSLAVLRSGRLGRVSNEAKEISPQAIDELMEWNRQQIIAAFMFRPRPIVRITNVVG